MHYAIHHGALARNGLVALIRHTWSTISGARAPILASAPRWSTCC
jgi:hypothetical protein